MFSGLISSKKGNRPSLSEVNSNEGVDNLRDNTNNNNSSSQPRVAHAVLIQGEAGVRVREGGGSVNLCVAGGLLLMYLSINLVFNVYNKWLFSGPLPAPVFVTATHQVFCFMGACLAALCAPKSWYRRTPLRGKAMWTKMMIIPFGFCLNIGLNNVSLLYTTLALNQLVRSFSPVAVAVASYYVEGRSYSMQKQMTLALLSLGVFLGVGASPDFQFVGFLFCVASVMGSTLQIVFTGCLVGGQNVKAHVFDILLYTAIPSIIVLAPLAYAVGDYRSTEQAIQRHGPLQFTGLVTVGGLLAFSYNLVTICLIKYTSSVYCAVAGGFKVVLVIALSFLAFNQDLSFLSLVGLIFACAAFVANSYLTFKETQEKENGLDCHAREKNGTKRKFLDEESDDEGDDRTGLISGKPKSIDNV